MIKRSQMINDDLIYFRCYFDIMFLLKFLQITKIKQVVNKIIDNKV